jgi:hypothetical protein
MDGRLPTYIWTPTAPIAFIQASPAIVQTPTFPKPFRVIQFSQREINEYVKICIVLHTQELRVAKLVVGEMREDGSRPMK